MGNLYNTEAIITALLDKKIGLNLSHVRGMKDLKKLKLFKNPNYSIENEVDGELPAMFSCPITKMEFNGNHPFVAIWTTGFVLSEKAIKELGIEALQEEYGPFTSDDIIRLIPTPFEIEAQTAHMLARRNKKKAEKAQSKASGKEDPAVEGESCRKRKHKDQGVNGENGGGKHEKVEAAMEEPRAVKNISKASTLVRSAADAVKSQQQSSSVFKGLFHNDKEKDKHDRDLFMSVAGIRYTLG
jgi:hypothetical protein